MVSLLLTSSSGGCAWLCSLRIFQLQHVSLKPAVSPLAGVTVRSYKVIYDLLDDMRAAMEGKLAALEQRVPLGQAEVRAVFGKGSKLVAGCMVTEGSLREDCFVVVS